MKKLFAVALGVLTAIGGFVDIGDLVTNAVVGSRFGLGLAWVVLVGRRRHLRLRPDVRPRRRGERAGDVRDHPRAPRAPRRHREPRGLVPHQPADGDRRDRRRRARAAARDERGPRLVDPGRRVRRVDRGLAGAVRPARERDRAARAHPDRVRGGPVHALARLGIARGPGAPARARPTASPSRRTGTTRSRCSARR